MHVKIILRKNMETLGKMGEIKRVKMGYARNYLLPRGVAFLATPANLAWWKAVEQTHKKAQEKEEQKAHETVEKLKDVALSFTRPVSPEGQLFGSVGKADIAKSLKASGFSIDRGQIMLETPLKQVGDFEVELRLGPAIRTKIKVSVLARR